MATHSSVLAWRIPGTGEPGGLQSMGSHRVGQDCSDLAAAAAAAPLLCLIIIAGFVLEGQLTGQVHMVWNLLLRRAKRLTSSQKGKVDKGTGRVGEKGGFRPSRPGPATVLPPLFCCLSYGPGCFFRAEPQPHCVLRKLKPYPN